jgi:hypothetical protein
MNLDEQRQEAEKAMDLLRSVHQARREEQDLRCDQRLDGRTRNNEDDVADGISASVERAIGELGNALIPKEWL